MLIAAVWQGIQLHTHTHTHTHRVLNNTLFHDAHHKVLSTDPCAVQKDLVTHPVCYSSPLPAPASPAICPPCPCPGSHQSVPCVCDSASESQFLSLVQVFVTPWTVAYEVPPAVGFPRQEEYWSGLPFPSPGDLPDQGSNADLLPQRQTCHCLSQQEARVIDRLICVIFLILHVSGIMRSLSFSFRLTSLSMIISRCIRVATNGTVPPL